MSANQPFETDVQRARSSTARSTTAEETQMNWITIASIATAISAVVGCASLWSAFYLSVGKLGKLGKENWGQIQIKCYTYRISCKCRGE